MSDNQAKQDYEKLKEQVFPKGDKTETAITLRRVMNVSLSLKLITDIGTMVLFTVAPILPVTPLASLASAGLGAASLLTTAGRINAIGHAQADDTQDAKNYRAEFKKAAHGFLVKQGASTVLLAAAPFLLGMFAISSFGNAAQAQFFYFWTMASALAGGGLGLWARTSATKMNVYDAAINRAKQAQKAAPAP